MIRVSMHAVGIVDPGNPILPRSVSTDSVLELDIVIACVEATYAVDPCSSLFTSCFTVFLTPFVSSSLLLQCGYIIPRLVCCYLFHGCLCV